MRLLCMLEESMVKFRDLTSEEIALIDYLANKAKIQLKSNWMSSTIAVTLTQERIGSIGLVSRNSIEFVHKRSREIYCCKFHDTDNIDVTAYLLVDPENTLYELDLWKVDDSEILHIPSVGCMEDIPQIG